MGESFITSYLLTTSRHIFSGDAKGKSGNLELVVNPRFIKFLVLVDLYTL